MAKHGMMFPQISTRRGRNLGGEGVIARDEVPRQSIICNLKSTIYNHKSKKTDYLRQANMDKNKILVIDDEQLITSLCKRVLEKNG